MDGENATFSLGWGEREQGTLEKGKRNNASNKDIMRIIMVLVVLIIIIIMMMKIIMITN